ncbi:MAG: DNA replication protein [Acidimicrobiia bacterium]|nr:DNA replication protein [Acidimicrobiia bacterium]
MTAATADAGRQLALAFAHRAAFGADDFLVAPSNADAVAWVDRWRTWAHPVLVLHGSPGCGKTHLGHVFLGLADGIAIAAKDLGASDLTRLVDERRTDTPAMLVEDADRIDDPAAEHALFHLHNLIVEARGRLLLTARAPATHWPVALPDLASRMRAAPAVAIAPPDEALIGAVLVKQFADRQVRVDPAVIAFLVARMERSFDAARRLVDTLDAAALSEGRAITVPLVSAVLARLSDETKD